MEPCPVQRARGMNNRDDRKNFRVAYLYSISNSYSISKCAGAAFAEDFTQPRDAFDTLFTREDNAMRQPKPSPAEAGTSFFQCRSYKGSYVYAHLEFRNDRDAQCPQQ